MASSSATRLFLLGAFRLERNAQPLRLPTRKAEMLLAYLALHPQPQSREKLAALLWGDSPDEQARASLRSALTALRRVVGEDWIVADRETVQLNLEAGLWVDALTFKTQAEALNSTAMPNFGPASIEIYGGDLLADCYDDWLGPERESLRQLYLSALAHLTTHYRAHGEYAQAIETAERILSAEPADEAAHQSLMQSYWALGEREAALRQYTACQQVLRTELGVEPTAQTTALYQQIRRARVIPASLNNLPAPLTSFIGRAREIESIVAELQKDESAQRLHTLIGPGGAGKTRLALRVAETLGQTPRFPDGVWWVELAAVAEASLVPQAVAKVLGLRENPGQSIVHSLATFVQPKRMLLVLDNCEHLIFTCAALAEHLLRGGPQLKILATSREVLNLTGEHVWPVPPLEASSEATRLFSERAAAVKFGFTVSPANTAAIAQICQRLDGLPLAIELAAARVRALSPEQIAARLDDRFNLLTTGNRAALPRQQTLRAALDWSYDLLEAAEQTVFRRLAVFAGGFTLEAAEKVIGDEFLSITNPYLSLLDILTRLIDKSLLLAEQDRYHMLETLHEYAVDKLWLSGEEPDLRRRHLQWCVQLVEEAEPKLISAEQAEWQERLEQDHANLRAALRWAATGAEMDVALGLRLAGALWRFWDQRGYLGESHQQLAALLALPAAQTPTPARAKTLMHAGILAHYQMHRTTAEELLNESLRLWQMLGPEHRRFEALTRFHMGFAAHRVGDLAAARTQYEASLALWRELGDEWGLSETLSNLGMLVRRENDYAHAYRYHAESLSLKRKIGDPRGVAYALWGLGQVALAQGNLIEAKACFNESLTIAHQLQDLWTLPYNLEGLALLAVAEGQPKRAAQLFGAASVVRERTGSPTAPIWNAEHEQALQLCREQIGLVAFEAAWAHGKTQPLKDTVKFALEAQT
jgi:non-specific serine/threonine protein kinase